jgi:hypothetical protein
MRTHPLGTVPWLGWFSFPPACRGWDGNPAQCNVPSTGYLAAIAKPRVEKRLMRVGCINLHYDDVIFKKAASYRQRNIGE